MTSVKAIPVKDIDGADVPPGAFEICETTTKDGQRTAGMWYNCPCGCGVRGYLPFRPEPSPSWEWDGNREAPTLSPSILHQSRVNGKTIEHYHGWLRQGVWEST